MGLDCKVGCVYQDVGFVGSGFCISEERLRRCVACIFSSLIFG